VHGLNGHREKSWTDKSGILWLRDLLPLQLPNARVLTFGYDADTLKLTPGVSQLGLSDHAASLVAELLRVRADPEVIGPHLVFWKIVILYTVHYRLSDDQSYSLPIAWGASW
jgi:hypothetical protein